MNELQVFNFNQVDVVDSREVAKLVERQHKNLLADIRGYIKTMENANGLNFQPVDFFIQSTYKDDKGETRPCYLLTKKGCDMVANKMTGEKGVLFTAVYVTAFEKMRENMGRLLPKDYPSALRALANEAERNFALEEKNRALAAENEVQRQAIADFQPMQEYINDILTSDRSLTTTQIAADYNMSAKRLNRILNGEGIQHYVNGQWILYKKHMGKGYTKSKTIKITRSDGKSDTVLNTEWTQKGRLMIHEILTAKGIKAVMDQG